ncbi:MAG: response regulator [Bacteroidetes bacterium]|nr:response regulator [Bacteroidota bacterium]
METLLPNIYLVEDDPFYNEVVKKSLAKSHFKIKTFTSGADYLKEIQRHQPDLAIIDYELKNANGMDLVEKTKSLNSSINVVILSAQQKLELISEAIKCGASYIHKDQTAFSKLKMIAHRTEIDMVERREDRMAMIYRIVFFVIFTLLAIAVIILRHRDPALFNNRG